MKHTSIRKPLSVLLSILMVLSVFGGMAFSAGAESKTIAEGVIYKLGDTIVLPGNGVYYVKDSERHPAQRIYSNGTVTRFESDGYSYRLQIDGWNIYTYIDMFDHLEELNQGLSVLGITFTGSGTESDPYMPKLAFGEIESTWAGDGEGTEDAPWLIDPSESPVEQVERQDRQESIKSCFEFLPDVYRTVFLLIDVQEMDYQAVSDMLRIPLGTVKSRLLRARLRMRDCLKSKGNF